MVRLSIVTAAFAALLCSSLPAAQLVKTKYYQTLEGQAEMQGMAEQRKMTAINAMLQQAIETGLLSSAQEIKVSPAEQDAAIQRALVQAGIQEFDAHKQAIEQARRHCLQNLKKLSSGLVLAKCPQALYYHEYSKSDGTLVREEYQDVFQEKIDERNNLIKKYTETERLAAYALRTTLQYGIPCVLVAALLYFQNPKDLAKVNWDQVIATMNLTVVLPILYAIMQVPHKAYGNYLEYNRLAQELARLDESITVANELLYPAWQEGDPVAQHLQNPYHTQMWERSKISESSADLVSQLIFHKVLAMEQVLSSILVPAIASAHEVAQRLTVDVNAAPYYPNSYYDASQNGAEESEDDSDDESEVNAALDTVQSEILAI